MAKQIGKQVTYGSYSGTPPMMPARHSAMHPGFASVQSKIAKKQGISKDRAGAILANAGRNASKKAKKANPRLKKIRGA